MKAQKVNENIRFEKGLDPKDAMGLGLNAKVMAFLKWVREDYQFDKDNSDYMGYINLGYDMFSAEWLKEGFRLFVKDWKKYLNIMANMGLYLIDPPDLDETIFYDEDNPAPGVEAISESANFERGLDPKDAMGIGENTRINSKLYRLKELDREEEDIILQITAVVEDVERYNGLWITTRNYPGPQKSYLRNLLKETGLNRYLKGILEETSCEGNSYFNCGTREYRYEIKKEYQKYFIDTDQVNESINFERGMDPKEAMGLGLDKGIIDLIKLIKDHPNFDKGSDDYKGHLAFDITKILTNHFRIAYENFVKDWRRYLDILKSNGLYIFVEPEMDFTIFYDEPVVAGKRAINESHNFERGKDPFDAMNIGKKAYLKERASKIQWDWYPDPSDVEKVLGLETWKGNNKYNIKIARLKDNLGYTAYYAVSDTGEPYMESPTFYETPGEALHFELIFLKEFDKDQDPHEDEDFLK
jgi:hypothetical protein